MAQKIWNGTTGTWSTAANWNPAGVPADGDDVALPDSGSPYTLTLDVDTALLDSLAIGDPAAGVGLITLDLGAFTLNVNGTGGGANRYDQPPTVRWHADHARGWHHQRHDPAAYRRQPDRGRLRIAEYHRKRRGRRQINGHGGTRGVSGTVDSGVILTIDTTAGSTLNILGTATSAAAITINDANQKLEIGPAGSLTIGAAESITNGTIQLDGLTSTLTAGGD